MSVSFPCALRADPQEAPGPEILDWIGPVPAEGPVRGGLVLVGPRGAGGRTALAGVAEALAQRGARLVRLPPDPWWATSAAHVLQAIGDALGGPPAEPHPPDRAEAAEAGRLRTHLRGTPVWVVVDGLDALLRRLPASEARALVSRSATQGPLRWLATAAQPLGSGAVPWTPLPRWHGADASRLARAHRATLPPHADPTLRALAPWHAGLPGRITAWAQDPGAPNPLDPLLAREGPRFDAAIDALAPQLGRVLRALALAPRLPTPAALGRALGHPTNHLTAALARLEADGFARPEGRPDGRSRYWTVADPLLRVWVARRAGQPALADGALALAAPDPAPTATPWVHAAAQGDADALRALARDGAPIDRRRVDAVLTAWASGAPLFAAPEAPDWLHHAQAHAAIRRGEAEVALDALRALRDQPRGARLAWVVARTAPRVAALAAAMPGSARAFAAHWPSWVRGDPAAAAAAWPAVRVHLPAMPAILDAWSDQANGGREALPPEIRDTFDLLFPGAAP